MSTASMYENILQYISNKKHKKFELSDLENHLISLYQGQSGYYMNGGYQALRAALVRLKEEGRVREISKSHWNGNPKYPLKTRWTIQELQKEQCWNDMDIFKVSDLLSLKKYLQSPELQTPQQWYYITRIHSFLKQREGREWASTEERCLELFDDEKFLYRKENREILSRLGLRYEDLKMKEYGEQFIHWSRTATNHKTVMILENHSTFFSCKRALSSGCTIFGITPDILIFGQGNKIVGSFSFIDEIVDSEDIAVYYFGDIDPYGFAIYLNLKKRYPAYSIKLHLECYAHLLRLCEKNYPCEAFTGRETDLEEIVSEFAGRDSGEGEKIRNLWAAGLRVPQELITYEYLKDAYLKDKDLKRGNAK